MKNNATYIFQLLSRIDLSFVLILRKRLRYFDDFIITRISNL